MANQRSKTIKFFVPNDNTKQTTATATTLNVTMQVFHTFFFFFQSSNKQYEEQPSVVNKYFFLNATAVASVSREVA